MLVTRIIAIAACFSGAAALAQQAPPPTASPTITVTGETPEPKEKVVCKDTSTGTILRRRICLTDAEWTKAEENAEGAMRTMREWQRFRCGGRC